MNLTPHQYYCMTHAEFVLKLRGFQTSKTREWEHTRQVCYTIASNAFGRKQKLPPISQWWKLPTDKVTAQPIEEMRNKWQLLKQNERNAKSKD